MFIVLQMVKFESITGTVVGRPIIEMESPFYLTFSIDVGGEIMPATFIGDFARALKNNILPGDRVNPRKGFIDNGTLVFDFMHMELNAAVGRNTNVYV